MSDNADTGLARVEPERGAMVEVASTRAAREVEAMIIAAKRVPRDEDVALAKMLKACESLELAEGAHYEYKRGNSIVRGESIRLVEEMARTWGNVDYGTVVIDSNERSATLMTYCLDLENNVRRTNVFPVVNQRWTKTATTDLRDPRDVYEHQANMATRRLRGCILQIIPSAFARAASQACDETLRRNFGKNLKERIGKMVGEFESKFGVTKEMIEATLGHNIEAINESEWVSLRNKYASLRDGVAKPLDLFSAADTPAEDARAATDAANAAQGALDRAKAKRTKRDTDSGDGGEPAG